MFLPNTHPESIKFASLLTYVPKKRWDGLEIPENRLDKLEISQECMINLKRGHRRPHTQSIYDLVAKMCADSPMMHDFFDDAILIPVPNSTLAKANTLHPSRMLVHALTRQKLGSGIAKCLFRIKYVGKSAWSSPGRRPTPDVHRESMKVERMLTIPRNVVLVDDIVTTGSTFLGSAWRLTDAYPNAHINAFAAMRTMSDVNKFTEVVHPCQGTIKLTAYGKTTRQP